jgi:hypothetical protein
MQEISMFKRIALIMMALGLSGCAEIKDKIPSRWDYNQSMSITNIQQTTRHLDCTMPLAVQVTVLQNQIEWFQIYSETKGTKDVHVLMGTLNETTNELAARASKGEISTVYCNMKKKILVEQANIVGDAIQSRF